MATEMANQALNFDTKEAFLASDFNGITIADKLIEQTGLSEKKLNQNFRQIGCFCRVLYPLWKQDIL
jgi:hypothetical protein